MKYFQKNNKSLQFFSNGSLISYYTNYLVPFKKIKFIEQDFNKLKNKQKISGNSKSSYRKNFF